MSSATPIGRQLVVFDDEAGISKNIARLAHDQGWIVRSSATVEDFHALIEAGHPDLVMLDLMLGSADGVQELRYLAAAGFTGGVALLSGFDPRVLASAKSLGESLGLRMMATIQKPFRANQIREILREASAGIDTARTPSPKTPSQARLPDFTPGEIAAALADDHMRLYLQPIHSTMDRTITRFEGLIRWHHPTRGVIPPDQFIPLAERDNSVIDHLTMWVIKAAIVQYRHLALLGKAIPISVNVSGVNLDALNFPDRVVALVEGSGVPPSGLVFEVTETVAMHEPRTTTDILTRLRLKGFGIAMDDFGTGYSSLKILSQMPFSEIKIDKSFVAQVISSRDSFSIVKSVIDLARNMGLECVAEGVETEETAWVLSKLGATSLQGYLFHRPLHFEDILRMFNP